MDDPDTSRSQPLRRKPTRRLKSGTTAVGAFLISLGLDRQFSDASLEGSETYPRLNGGRERATVCNPPYPDIRLAISSNRPEGFVYPRP